MNMSVIGFICIVCALLLATNKEKYRALLKGFNHKRKIAISYYFLVGMLLVMDGYLPYLDDSRVAIAIVTLSIATIIIVHYKKIMAFSKKKPIEKR